MISSAKLHFILLLLCVSFFSFIEVSLGGERLPSNIASLSLLAPSAAATSPVTCPVPLERCGSECDRRCSDTEHKNNCLLFCNKCCDTCLCVPPGTYGHKECCPCYNDWKTKEGGPKCP